MLPAALALAGTAAATPADSVVADAEEWSCALGAGQVVEAEIDAVWEAFDDPQCWLLIEVPLAHRLDELLRAGERPTDVSEAEVDATQYVLDATLLRLALLRGDRAAARPLLAALRANRHYVEAIGDEELGAPSTSSWFDPLAQTERVLAGPKAVPPFRLEAPGTEWTLQFSRCGTGMFEFALAELRWPSPADAWVALGEPHVALQELIATQWVESIQAGFTPPRLREFADRALGRGRYEPEVDAALASIRIEDTLGGRRAGMPVFGMWVPLPIGYQSEGKPLHRFETPDAIAAFLRPMLLAVPGRE